MAVARGDRVGDARVDRGVDRVVQRLGTSATQAHVGHRRPHPVGRYPVHAGDDVRERALSTAVEHAYRDDAYSLGHAVRRSTERARDVGPVAAAVVRGAAVDKVDTGVDTTGEVAVEPVQTGVEHIHVHVGGGGRVRVGPVDGEVALVDAIQAHKPGGVDWWPRPARSRPARPA